MYVHSTEWLHFVCLFTPRIGFIVRAYSLHGVVLLYLLIHSAGSAHQFHRDDSLCMHVLSAEYNDNVYMSTPRSGCILYAYSLCGVVISCVLIHSAEWFDCVCSSISRRGVHVNSMEIIHGACMFHSTEYNDSVYMSTLRSGCILYAYSLRGVVLLCVFIHSVE